MNKSEVYKEFADNLVKTYGFVNWQCEEAWNAACEWQKEKDAELCDKISNYKDYGKEADCSYAIRNQDD